MQSLTLQQMFGINATQDSQQLTIRKADLPGLTPSTNNRAEQLLVALLLQAYSQYATFLTDEIGQLIVYEDYQPIDCSNNFASIEKLQLSFWKTQVIKRNNTSFFMSTFVIDVFISPVTEVDTPLTAHQL